MPPWARGVHVYRNALGVSIKHNSELPKKSNPSTLSLSLVEDFFQRHSLSGTSSLPRHWRKTSHRYSQVAVFRERVRVDAEEVWGGHSVTLADTKCYGQLSWTWFQNIARKPKGLSCLKPPMSFQEKNDYSLVMDLTYFLNGALLPGSHRGTLNI